MKVIVAVAALLALAGCMEPCWTEKVCGPPRRYTAFVMIGKAIVPMQRTTRDCTCPPKPAQHVEREEPTP